MFQHSAKSRDWRALDQNLENVFGATETLPTPGQQNYFNAPVQGSNPNYSNTTSHKTQNDIDDWGDFSSAAPSVTQGPAFNSQIATPVSQSQSIGCR